MDTLNIAEIVRCVSKLCSSATLTESSISSRRGSILGRCWPSCIPAKDIGGLRARWMLVGTLTWAVPAESDKLKDPDVPKADGDEPQFEVYPEEGEEGRDEVQVKEGQEEAAGEKEAEEDPMDVRGKEDEVKEGGQEKAEES